MCVWSQMGLLHASLHWCWYMQTSIAICHLSKSFTVFQYFLLLVRIEKVHHNLYAAFNFLSYRIIKKEQKFFIPHLTFSFSLILAYIDSNFRFMEILNIYNFVHLPPLLIVCPISTIMGYHFNYVPFRRNPSFFVVNPPLPLCNVFSHCYCSLLFSECNYWYFLYKKKLRWRFLYVVIVLPGSLS